MVHFLWRLSTQLPLMIKYSTIKEVTKDACETAGERPMYDL